MAVFAVDALAYAGQRLPLLASRVIKPPKHAATTNTTPPHAHGHTPSPSAVSHDLKHGSHGHHHHHAEIQSPIGESTALFAKNHAAANFELFYDLWFVANLNVFTSVHEIALAPQLASYIGFIVLLWTTWLNVTIYDVRFNADCVFERVCKAIHLGVMVGFAMIGTSFNPDNQIKSIFQAMSFFLAASRLTLCIQHSVLAYQVRKFAEGTKPLLVTAFLNFAAGAVYFGIAFRFDPSKNSRVYVVWYVAGVVEMAAHLGFSQLSRVLTFVGSHFGERLNLLTLIIIGEGCIIVAKNVTLIVKDTYLKGDTAMWTPQLIGIMTASAALLYIIFQLYFDWMHEEQGQPMYEAHQIWWASLHLPFHISLVLLLEGASQFVIWFRVLEDVDKATTSLVNSIDTVEDATADNVVKAFEDVVYKWLKKYPPAEQIETYSDLSDIFEELRGLGDSFYAADNPDQDQYEQFLNHMVELLSTLTNSIFYAFGIEAPENRLEGSTSIENIESQSTMAISQRFVLIFIYAFACAGVVMVFLSIMHSMSKRKGWTPFNIFRTGVCLFCGVGLSLTGLLVLNEDFIDRFMGSAWMLPVITLVYFLILVMTHLPHPTKFGLGHYSASKEYLNVEKPQSDGHYDHHEGTVAEHVPLHHIRSAASARPGHQRNISGVSAYDDFRSPGLMAPSPQHSPDSTPRKSTFGEPYSAGGEVPVSPYDPTRDGHHDDHAAATHRASTINLYPVDLYDDHEHRERSNRISTYSQHGAMPSPSPPHGQTEGVATAPAQDLHERRRSTVPLASPPHAESGQGMPH
ncbi:uncharacterized protein B0I36DRAFT_331004 [Microdochium trichocladiopsis]|uniref:Bacterial low temperature requirement A protein-domain-containing protein n=1 Tax=Microdochium trichocladiopsis TaxID=1682393 RepID=A0A9P8Y309_9PEZI|nr:uncharacterized protein B0I36DRAFT_331004 [Microdochium trichocladiopsis]KAH7026609.1 hypothetical protein B0I36DRAFT_331004 [Microdochium trichocladiopsis]